MLSLGLPDFTDGVAPLTVLLLAFALDALMGDPPALYERIPHPVAMLGRLIARLEKRFNDPGRGDRARFRTGLVASLGVIAVAFACGWLLSLVLRTFPSGWLVEALIASSLIAFRGLYDNVAKVRRDLEHSLDEGRQAVSHIVGRDPQSLDEHGVARATIESTAENFSDGVVAPIFWYALLGLPGIAAYKAVNTLDSMIGHRNARYESFGRFAAKLDDAANLIPARLAGLAVCVAAAFGRTTDANAAWRAMRRDAAKHRSPNAGWPEAAMAGALGLKLAGPRTYGDTRIEDAWMGDGRAEATTADIRRALALYLRANLALAVAIALLLLL